MYKVTAWFKNRKISEEFYDVNDAIEYRDNVDAHYPLKVTFRKVISMREWIYNSWNLVMDHERNPLSAIPDFSTRHMIMQVLAWMWCIVFGIIVGSMYMGVFSMVLHTLLLGAVAVTVGTFETAKRKPQFFGGFGRGQGGEHE
jgi:tetrahydromethanopterin S-methyltransferase subunit B